MTNLLFKESAVLLEAVPILPVASARYRIRLKCHGRANSKVLWPITLDFTTLEGINQRDSCSAVTLYFDSTESRELRTEIFLRIIMANTLLELLKI